LNGVLYCALNRVVLKINFDFNISHEPFFEYSLKVS